MKMNMLKLPAAACALAAIMLFGGMAFCQSPLPHSGFGGLRRFLTIILNFLRG